MEAAAGALDGEAAGVAAGAASDFDDGSDFAAPSPETFALPEAPSPEPAAAGGLGEEYRSLYQPEPLNWIAGAVNVRSSGPLQKGQTVISGSENF